MLTGMPTSRYFQFLLTLFGVLGLLGLSTVASAAPTRSKRAGYNCAIWRRHGLLFVLLLLLIPVFALADTDPLAQPRFVSVGDAGVITDGVVSAIAQDAQGLVWVGTSAGLLRYDGYQFHAFKFIKDDTRNAGTSFVRSILPIADGRLWIGTESDGLGLFDPRSEQWTFYRSEVGNPAALSPGTIRALAQDSDGSLWVGTIGGGLNHLDPRNGSVRHYRKVDGSLKDDRIQSLLQDSRGDLWVGSWSGLTRRLAGSDRFSPVFSDPAAGQAELAEKIISMLAEAPDGRIWVGTQQGDLLIIDPATGSGQWLDRAQTSGSAKRSSVTAMTSLNAQEVWVARASGLELRALSDGRLLGQVRHDMRKPWGLASNDVRVLLRDAAGWIWVGSYGGGLQRHDPKPNGLWVRRPDDAQDSVFAEVDVRSLLQLRQGEIWVGTAERGIAVMNQQLHVIAAIPPVAQGRPGFKGGRVGGLAQTRDGHVWAGTDTLLYEFSPERKLLGEHVAGKGRVRRLLATQDGALWVGTQDGLYRRRPGTGGIERFTRVTLIGGQALHGDINALVEAADGSVWVGGETGLYRQAPTARELQVISSPPGAGLANPSVLGLLLDRQQTLWVDTSAGLHRMIAFDGAQARFDQISERHGVGGRAFGANLLEDARGRIWTQRWVFDPAAGDIFEFRVADGADIGTGWFRAYTQLADGRLLFGGSKGLQVVEPEKFERWSYAPPLVVSELRIGGLPVPAQALQDGLRLTPEQRSFSVEFAALDYSDPGQNRYRYQLVGFDAGWINTGADFRVASYSNLDPGRYLLQVHGSNRVGDWSPHQLSIQIDILPAWWQTWWARLLAALLLGGLILGVVQLRTRLLLQRQLALERRVSERTEELHSLTLELRQKSQALELSSLSDPLTGLRNRRFLTQHIDADLAQSLRRHKEQRLHGAAPTEEADLIFFLLDIDHFKQVNDRHGHSAGDAVIRQIHGRLQQVFRASDYLVRWGGEEFLIVARDSSRAHAADLAERARAAVAEQAFVLDDGHALFKTCSIGFACFPLSLQHPQALDWAAMVDLADAAMYRIKHGGRNGWFGLVSARSVSPEALLERSRQTLEPWITSGELEVASHQDAAPAR